MQALRRSYWRNLSSVHLFSALSSSRTIATLCSSSRPSTTTITNRYRLPASPWSVLQCRGAKISASDVKVGNIIEKQGRIFEVIKVDHSHEGRGKATMKVELRDIGYGNKVTQRYATDDSVERVFVQEKSYMYMCTDRDGTVVLMDPESLDQLEVSKDLFGKKAVYLKDDMKVKIQLYDDTPLSATVPKKVTCVVREAQGVGDTPRYKKVVLDNGMAIEVPPHIGAGDAVVISTEHDTYVERAKV